MARRVLKPFTRSPASQDARPMAAAPSAVWALSALGSAIVFVLWIVLR